MSCLSRFRHTGLVAAAALAASFVTTPPAFAAGDVPKVFADTAKFWVAGVTAVTFFPGQGEDMSEVTSLTLFADGEQVGTDTAAPWGIDWDATGLDGVVTLSTRATTADGVLTTEGGAVVVDNKPATGLTVGFPRKDGYVGQGGELTVRARDNIEVSGSELVVGGRVVSSKDLAGGGNLDLPWTVKVPNGRTAMTVRVRDIAGNVTALTRTVTVDNDRPVITGISTAGSTLRGGLQGHTQRLSGRQPAGELRGLAGQRDHGGTYGTDSRTATIESRHVPDGRYTLGWHATDAAGNVAVVTRSVTVDNKAPAVSIARAPKNRAKVKKKFTVTATASDTYGIAKVQLLVNGKVVKTDTTAGYSFTVNPKKYGKKFTVRVRAYDKAGNVTSPSTHCSGASSGFLPPCPARHQKVRAGQATHHGQLRQRLNGLGRRIQTLPGKSVRGPEHPSRHGAPTAMPRRHQPATGPPEQPSDLERVKSEPPGSLQTVSGSSMGARSQPDGSVMAYSNSSR